MSFMYKCFVGALVLLMFSSCVRTQRGMSSEEIMKGLTLFSEGKTEVVKNFPDSFPEVLIKRGMPTVYIKANSDNFNYIGMSVGGIGAGQLYLGGYGKLWFWDIFGLNYHAGQLKGEEAYQYPYMRDRPNDDGARLINQDFSVSYMGENGKITKYLCRDDFRNIRFKGQYPVGEVTYDDSIVL